MLFRVTDINILSVCWLRCHVEQAILNLTTKSRITLYLSGSVFSGYGCIPGEGLKRNGRRGALSLAVNTHPVKLNPPNAPAFAGVFRICPFLISRAGRRSVQSQGCVCVCPVPAIR